jgi:hypothetical protein
MTIHLGANWNKKSGIAPADLVDIEGNAEEDLLFAVLAAAAHHPAWVRKIDGEKTPGVWMPGCRIMVEGDREAGEHAISLGYSLGNREIMLSLDWPDGRDRRYAIPVRIASR